jgi:hypothetical protein
MNKDKLQVGDLVTHSIFSKGIGLAIKKKGWTAGVPQSPVWEIYWFKTGDTYASRVSDLAKL